VRGTLHWVSATEGVKAQVNVYDHLFLTPNPNKAEEGKDFTSNLNPESLTIIKDAVVEPELSKVEPGTKVQFLRNGYFVADIKHTAQKPVFNRTVTLKDTWARIKRNQK
jgi:glutaminyl-tRNA synthetase